MKAELGQTYQAKVIETFWLINGMLAELPLSAVRELAARSDVLYVEPNEAGSAPPQDGNANNDVDDGRARLVSARISIWV